MSMSMSLEKAKAPAEIRIERSVTLSWFSTVLAAGWQTPIDSLEDIYPLPASLSTHFMYEEQFKPVVQSESKHKWQEDVEKAGFDTLLRIIVRFRSAPTCTK
jgi:hypothetical protein